MIDISTVLGLVIGLGGLVVGILLEGGNLGMYWGLSAFACLFPSSSS